uniref:Activating transcription factor 5 n=1 Tax=Cynoglossus semilaevis TaxID=244447 RepID=A0A3P8UZF9_CYNSE
MAASILRRKIPPISTGELGAPFLQQASYSQSHAGIGAEPVERQHLIGDGHSDWMTEKVDLSSFVSTTESSPSSSLPPSPLEQDVKVPSDLEVMTSLLQEELAQLEDYFRSESTSTTSKLEKSSKCDKGAQAMGSQSYYQLPYGSYGSSQAETSPVVVTLSTGELDLSSFCGGPIGRSKIARPAPYNYHHRYHHHHHHHNNGRRIISDAVKVGDEAGLDSWGSRGGYSGSTELSVNHYSTLKTVSKNSLGSVKKVRECALSLKEEESYCFSEGMFCSEEIARGFCLGGSYESHHKREGQLMHNVKVNVSYDSTGLDVLHCNKDGGLSGGIPQETMVAGDGYFHQSMASTEPYHSFISDLDQPSQTHAVEPQHGHYLYPECLADQSYECLSRGESEGPLMGAPIHRPTQRLKDEHCPLKPSLVMGTTSMDMNTGEKKQKKRDQNKMYRLRKRAELDSLEEELHGLEGQNRELRDKAESVEREIQYVKDLLIEVYKARSQRLKQDGSA